LASAAGGQDAKAARRGWRGVHPRVTEGKLGEEVGSLARARSRERVPAWTRPASPSHRGSHAARVREYERSWEKTNRAADERGPAVSGRKEEEGACRLIGPQGELLLWACQFM
jgi:hypothetical protein